MTEEEIKTAVFEEIANIAPDAELDGLDPQEDIREALDMDSMDIMNLVIALHKRLGIDIPEADAGRFVTVAGAVAFIAKQTG